MGVSGKRTYRIQREGDKSEQYTGDGLTEVYAVGRKKVWGVSIAIAGRSSLRQLSSGRQHSSFYV